jgi:hypothetical protein
MENDYYLHNFQVGDSAGMINRMYQLYTVPPDSSLLKPMLKVPSGGRHLMGTISRSPVPWWKAALLSHLKQRLWNSSSEPFDEEVLLPKFERLYQPEKVGHFDSILSREWETPHRRDHSAQHSAAHDDGAAFVRIVSRSSDPPTMDDSKEKSDHTCKISMLDKIGSFSTPGPTLFSGYFAEQRLNARTSYVGSDFGEESDVKPEYLKYCSQNSRPSAQVYSVEKVDEFKKALQETTMQADDVSGIREVSTLILATVIASDNLLVLSSKMAQSANLGSILSSGEYRGLHRDVSAIDAAKAMHEQFSPQTDFPVTEQRRVQSELHRCGFGSSGVQETASREWKSFSLAHREYTTIVAPKSGGFSRSALSDAETFKLYASYFDPNTELTTADQIFLGSTQLTRNEETPPGPTDLRPPQHSLFAQKAARLGINCTPYTAMVSTLRAHPHGLTPAGFEQINDEMFARKDNPFMVFNRVGMDCWESNSAPRSLPPERFLLSIFGDNDKSKP